MNNQGIITSVPHVVTVATKFTLVYVPLFPILQGRLQSWIVTIHEDNVPNNTVVNASKPINFGRYFEWMPKLQTLAETYQKATKNKVTWPLKAGKQNETGNPAATVTFRSRK